MTQQDILTLAKAGFTAQQIAALNTVNNGTSTEQINDADQSGTEKLDTFSQQLSDFTAMMQKTNLLTQAQPVMQTTDDILASIIAPPKQEVK